MKHINVEFVEAERVFILASTSKSLMIELANHFMEFHPRANPSFMIDGRKIYKFSVAPDKQESAHYLKSVAVAFYRGYLTPFVD